MFSSVLLRRLFILILLILLPCFISLWYLFISPVKKTAYCFENDTAEAILKNASEILKNKYSSIEKFQKSAAGLPDSEYRTEAHGKQIIREIIKSLDKMKITGSVCLFIFDTQMNIIYPPNYDIKRIFFFQSLEKTLKAGNQHSEQKLSSQSNDFIKIARIKYIKEFEWYLVMSLEGELQGEITGSRIRLVFIFILCGLLSFTAIVLILHNELIPVLTLGNMASEFIQKGRIASISYITGRGEVGMLGAAFYKMLKHIDSNDEKLKKYMLERKDLIRESEQNRERAYNLSLANKRLEQRIEESSEIEISLRKSEERYRAMLENIEEYFYEIDLLGNLIFFNDAFYKMLGYGKDELVGMNFRDFTDEETEEKAFQTFRKAHETGQPGRGFEWRLIRKDGTVCYVEISVSLIRDKAGEIIGFRGIARDISELLYLVYHDSLTGLYNRKAFFQKLNDTLAYAKRDKNEKNIFYMDLDKFKQVNDNYGHDVGDEVLKEVAERLRFSLRETDHICRLGGDEFTVILNNVNNPCPEEAAKRIIKILSKPYKIREHVIDFITPSIGISAYPKDADDIETLIKCADTAMYEAKKERGRYIFYDKSIDPELNKDL